MIITDSQCSFQENKFKASILENNFLRFDSNIEIVLSCKFVAIFLHYYCIKTKTCA